MGFSIRFNQEKSQLLKATRNISFEEIRDSILGGNLLADIVHPSKKHANQRLYVVRVKRYAYAVPYIINFEREEIFLKTAYPSRILTRRYIKGGLHGKKRP